MRIKIKIIPNNLFLGIILFLLIVNEIYNFKFNKDDFKLYNYDGAYDTYFKNTNYLHEGNSELDKLGLTCSLNKNLAIKKVQDNKFDEYKDILNSMDNVVYGDKKLENLPKLNDNFGDITTEIEKINKINNMICPPVCHLIENKYECQNAVDYKEVLTDRSKLITNKPEFNNKRMLSHANKCLRSKPCDINNGCKTEFDTYTGQQLCIYDKKKCEFDDSTRKCRQKCNIYESRDNCNKKYCKWNTNNLKCENKN